MKFFIPYFANGNLKPPNGASLQLVPDYQPFNMILCRNKKTTNLQLKTTK